jgi:hypothetical protein
MLATAVARKKEEDQGAAPGPIKGQCPGVPTFRISLKIVIEPSGTIATAGNLN